MRALRRLLLWLGALMLVPALGMPGPAAAATGAARVVSGAGTQGGGVHVDPSSPAGTEYQLPTDRAREQAGGGGGSKGSPGGAAGEAPLFGAGVEDRTPRPPVRRKPSSSDSTKRTASRSADTPMATATTSEQPDLGKRTQQPVRALAPAPDGSGGGMLAVAGGAAGVLLMGTLAGLAWRRRTTGS
jgi:hypothetical protein